MTPSCQHREYRIKGQLLHVFGEASPLDTKGPTITTATAFLRPASLTSSAPASPEAAGARDAHTAQPLRWRTNGGHRVPHLAASPAS